MHRSLPSLIFGVTAFAACLAAMLLPETKGVVIEESLEGAAKQAAQTQASGNRFHQLDSVGEEEEGL